ncbi:MAG: FtsQ-type POTRA domain-containing protein [Thermoleophilaceae bacterium]
MTTRTVALAPRAVFLALPPRARRRLLASAALAVLLAAAYLGWLRDSSLVAVEEVEVTGLTAPAAERIEGALTAAATDMTTLHVRTGELEQAVAGFPVVAAIRVEADFPHGLHIRVIEHRPVALLESDGESVPVAGDGTVLPDVEAGRSLPSIRADTATSAGRLSDGAARALVAVAGAAPAALLARVERIAPAPGRGIVVDLREGPELIFGDGSRPRAKWVAASAVLAEESSAGAGYLDLRIPERPAAGGLGAETVEPIDPAGAAAPEQASPAPQPASPAPPPGSELQPQVEGGAVG